MDQSNIHSKMEEPTGLEWVNQCICVANSEGSLRKHDYSNILNILQPKTENCYIKNSNIFHIPAQNIDCGYLLEPPRRGGSNEYPQSMF